MAPYVDSEETSKKDLKNPPKESPLAPLEKKIRELSHKIPKIEEKEMEINKEMKGEKRDKIRELTKDVGRDQKFDYSLKIVKDYFAKAKKSYSHEFERPGQNLHKYTLDVVNAMEDYIKDGGKFMHSVSVIDSIFKDTQLLDLWKDLDKSMAKTLKETIVE